MANVTRILGIDYGLKRIGVAFSDERKIIATPLTTVLAERKLEDTVKKVLEEVEKHRSANHYVIENIVVGMPYMMSGKKGLIADEVVHFVDLLKEIVTCPVITWDERLTSVQAERLLRESMSRKKRKSVVDQVSAVIILQSYLDSRSLQSGT